MAPSFFYFDLGRVLINFDIEKMLAQIGQVSGVHPDKVKEVLFFGTEAVNHHIDISNTFSLKLEALECHASQVKEFKVDDLETWLKKRCQRMAEGSAYTLAEAFHRVRMPD